jgi:hypothetical protein
MLIPLTYWPASLTPTCRGKSAYSWQQQPENLNDVGAGARDTALEEVNQHGLFLLRRHLGAFSHKSHHIFKRYMAAAAVLAHVLGTFVYWML